MITTANDLLNELDRREISIGIARNGQVILGPSSKIDRTIADQLVTHRDELKRLLIPESRFSLALHKVREVIERALASGKYPKGETWRALPVLEHVRHAKNHLDKWLHGDTGEPHLEHATTRALMALQNSLTGDSRQPEPAAEDTPTRKCWRCGAAGEPPSPAQQVAAIRAIQAGQPSCFQWSESELARLENRMEPGDFIVTVRTESVEVQRPDAAKYSHFRTDA